MGEAGGLNLYAGMDNNSLCLYDAVGFIAVTDIPQIMIKNGWFNGSALMNYWFSHRKTGKARPSTSIITMDWVLKYARAKKVYDDIFSQKVYSKISY